ncbi:LuxR C-terminal-related transcriptional regulator [Williamsia muralis]
MSSPDGSGDPKFRPVACPRRSPALVLPLTGSKPLPAPPLTAREIEILREWVMRDSKAEVAKALFITPATVSTHVNRIRLKYASVGRPANTKAALLARALQDGHIELNEL